MNGINVALVQLDFQPAYTEAGKDFLGEPDFPLLGKSSVRSLFDLLSELEESIHTTSQDAGRELAAWRTELRQQYQHMLTAKLRHVLDFACEKGVDILVFPEYSIPCDLLRFVRDSAMKMLIIAGTHTVDQRCMRGCAKLGFDVVQEDIGMALCPIFKPGGEAVTLHKRAASKWEEATLIPGRRWAPIQFEKDGVSYLIVVDVCVDFVSPAQNSFDGHEGQATISELEEQASLTIHVVPSLTPRPADDFEPEARKRAKRQDHLVVFANGASYGGSRIFFDNPRGSRLPLQDPLGSWTAASNEELLIGVHIDPRSFRRPRNFTPVPSPSPPMSQTIVSSFYYTGFREEDEALKILQGQRLRQSKSYIEQAMPASFLRRPHTTLRSKLQEMQRRLDGLPHAQISMLREAILLPSEIPTMDEWYYCALLASARFLQTLRPDHEDRSACRRTARDLLHRAHAIAQQAELRFSLQQVAERISPKGLLDSSVSVATRILRAPSSGLVDTWLAKWSETALSASQPDLDHISQVIYLVEQARPYPVKPFSHQLMELLSNTPPEYSAALDLVRGRLQTKEQARQAISRAAHAIGLITPSSRLLLYGYSGMITNLLREYAYQHDPTSVALTVVESKNRLELDSALEQLALLTKLGYQCRFLSSTSLARYLLEQNVDRVLIGANALVPNMLINTMGTLMLTVLARKATTPVISVISRYKFWPGEFWDSERHTIENMRRSGEGVLPEWLHEQSRIDIVNYAYDFIPYELVSTILTDVGVFGAGGEPFSRLAEHLA